MMTTQAQVPTGRQHARRSPFDRDVAARLAATEYQRMADVLDELGPHQWAAESGCPGWDVRAMAGHVLGMMQMVATVPELVRQQATSTLRARRDGGPVIDALTALQVDKNAALTPAETASELRRLAPRAVQARRRAPAILRNLPIRDESDGWWTVGYLFDVILTRDPFMHRLDITRATGLPHVSTPEHDGVIIDDVVREWAERHGTPYTLDLSGPAGGRWGSGEGERLAMDALEFCRTLSGRAPATGLLTVQVPF
jgi:uncharacterized protein (TIGR03083 family)